MQVATVGHLSTSPFSVLCASASTATGAHHAAQEEEPGSRTGLPVWGKGRSELVLALSLSLSFTSQRRSLCSARWRAQGWRGECRSKASDQVGKPWLPKSGVGARKPYPVAGTRTSAASAAVTAYLVPASHGTARSSFRTQAGCIRFLRLWLCSSIFCLHVRRVPCAVVKPHATPGSAASPVPQPHLELCQRVQAVALAAEPHGPLQVVLDVTAAQVLRAHANHPRNVSNSVDASGCV